MKCEHCGGKIAEKDVEASEVVDTVFEDIKTGERFASRARTPIWSEYLQHTTFRRRYVCPGCGKKGVVDQVDTVRWQRVKNDQITDG